MEDKIQKLMKSLSISREEALEVIEADKAIDKGEKLFELDPELEKGAKKARQADRKTTTVKRERKANPTKADLVKCMTDALTEAGFAESLEITNGEREFLFTFGGTKYKVTLACPRK